MKIINKINPSITSFSAIEVGETFVCRNDLNTIYMRIPAVRNSNNGNSYNAIRFETGYCSYFQSGTPVIRVKATLIVSNEDEPDPEPEPP